MYNSKDIKQIAERYSEVLNEGFLDRFKKKTPEAAPAPQPARKEEMQTVTVFGRPRKFSKESLMNDSETVGKVGDDVELKIYETSEQDIGSYRDIPIFIPVIVISKDMYPAPPSIIGAVGEAHAKKELAIEELNKLAVNYKPKPRQLDLDLR